MMPPRWNKVIADFFSNIVRSLLVIASIAVGLFAIGMIATIYQILSVDMRASYLSVNPANIRISASAFGQEMVDRVGHLDGVREASGAWRIGMRILSSPEQWSQLDLTALDFSENLPINRVELVEGKWPPEKNEIVVESNKFSEINAQIGDEVHIKLPSGKIRELRLVGIVHDQTIGVGSGGGGFFFAPATGYISNDTLDTLDLPESYNTIYATVDKDAEDLDYIQVVANRIVTEFDQNGIPTNSLMTHQASNHPNVTYLDAMAAVLFVLGFLVVFLSGFLITNTLSALLNQQVQQIGVMKTFGANSRQVTGVYMVLILVFSLIALAISIPLAQQAAYGLLRYLADQLNFNLQAYRYLPLTILAQVVIALIIPQIAGLQPIIQGSKITVQEALSGVGVGKFDDQGGINRWLARIRGLSRPLSISLRNTFRRRARLILTLLTLTLGGGIFIATFNVRSSLEAYTARLRQYYMGDVNLTFNELYRIKEVERDVMQIPGISAVEGWATTQAEAIQPDGSTGESVQLLAPPANSKLIVPMLRGGRWIQAGDENAIVVSEAFFETYPGLRIGDTIQLKISGDETDWIVVGDIQFAGRTTGLVAYANYDYLARLIHSPGKSNLFRIVASGDKHDLQSQEAVGLLVENHLEDLGYHIADVRAGLSLQESITSGLDILTTFLMIMALLMAAVGSIGLMGTMSLNVMERTREIGIIRAIGGSDLAITNMVIVEGMLIGLISWFLGLVVAYPISMTLYNAISLAIFGQATPFTFTITGIVIWFGLVSLLSILASVLPARNAARLTIREVLAYE